VTSRYADRWEEDRGGGFASDEVLPFFEGMLLIVEQKKCRKPS